MLSRAWIFKLRPYPKMTPCRPSGRMRSSRIDAIEIVAVEPVEPGAELAGHLDRPVSLQVLDLRAGHGLQHVFPIGRAHICTPVTTAQHLCRLWHEQKNDKK